jgi:polyphenol oxidase
MDQENLSLAQINNLPIYQFKNFLQLNNITHGITTRHGGKSEGNHHALNLSYMVNDSEITVKYNRNLVAKAFGVELSELKIPQQIHSNKVIIIDKNNSQDLVADALITKDNDVVLAVLLADCVPLILYDTENKVIAAIHAGWRGTIANITTATINEMQEQFFTKPKNIIAGIGPSIGPEVYEVGYEVKEAADLSFGKNHDTIILKGEKYFFNLWKANELQLIRCGVQKENIEIAGICTYQNADTFFSARKIKPVTGRFAAVVKLN